MHTQTHIVNVKKDLVINSILLITRGNNGPRYTAMCKHNAKKKKMKMEGKKTRM